MFKRIIFYFLNKPSVTNFTKPVHVTNVGNVFQIYGMNIEYVNVIIIRSFKTTNMKLPRFFCIYFSTNHSV